MEPSGEEKSGKTTPDMEAEHRGRDGGVRNVMGASEEDRPEPSPLEKPCCGPMLLNGARGLSQVSQVIALVLVTIR